MKRSFAKIVSVVLALMFALTAFSCMAAAETTVVKCNCCLNDTGSAGDTITKFQGPRDIYLVLDISGSMSGEPMSKLKEAAKEFCKTMIEDTTGDNRIVIVTYNTTVDSYSFSTDYDELAAVIDGFKAKGSTAMYDALLTVKEISEKYGNADASKHVVVMADGLPNEGAVLTSGKYTSKDSTMYYKHGNAVFSTAAGMWPDYLIYSIGFFHNLGGSQLRFGQTLMKDIQNALYLEVFDPDKLLDAFTGVADDIIGKPCNGSCKGECDCANCSCMPKDPCTDVTKPDGSCACKEGCTCGLNCACGENCTCSETTAPSTAPTTKPNNSIPQTGESFAGVAIAAVVMLAGIAVVATKKRED
ncbi:MAG: VWA domain-containing protein [Clostridia bacterium]|nr:VWA domain-containing protein [Clostridia bacterium]